MSGGGRTGRTGPAGGGGRNFECERTKRRRKVREREHKKKNQLRLKERQWRFGGLLLIALPTVDWTLCGPRSAQLWQSLLISLFSFLF